MRGEGLGLGDKKMRASKHHEQGLTLMEMIMSLTILSVGVLAALFVMITARQMAEDARFKLMAVNAAKSVLEVVKDTPMASVAAIDETDYAPAGLPDAVITILTNGASPLITVTVRVEWTGSKGRARQIEVSTMRSAY